MTNPFQPFLNQLQQNLREPLPGRDAQFRMAARDPDGRAFDRTARDDARRGAVLMLLYPHDSDQGEQVHLPLIVRPTYDGVHSGQVALPGGGREPADADLVATALREAHEEVGVPPSGVSVLGTLSPLYIFASNYLIQPVVGWAAARPDFCRDPREVAALVEAPLAELLDARSYRRERWRLRGHDADVPFFAVQGQTVWGATAMMLSELLALPGVRSLA